MRCFRCNSANLPLGPISENQRLGFPLIGVVMRQCADCGLRQNHYREDQQANKEPLDPFEAAEHSPVIQPNGTVVPARKLWVKPTAEVTVARAKAKREAVVEVSHVPQGQLSEVHPKTGG